MADAPVLPAAANQQLSVVSLPTQPAPQAPPAQIFPQTEDSPPLDRETRREVQRRLTLLGFDTRGVDGVFGAGTRGAIVNWQRSRGHPGSGFLAQGQLADLRAQSENAYQEWSSQQVRAQAQPAPRSTTGSRQAAPSGRYVDSRGCLREPDGRFVANFRADCR
jgi:peptidoglycan hydrolase-like protein with peptidoglycan-binding domain